MQCEKDLNAKALKSLIVSTAPRLSQPAVHFLCQPFWLDMSVADT